MTKPPRRLTPAESDALVAHLSPAEKRRRIEIVMVALRIKGVDVELFYDAAGRSYLEVDAEQVRRVAPELAEAMEALQELMPEPQGHRPPTA